jgi:AbrB family looped-hinge helix DNA binding protein
MVLCQTKITAKRQITLPLKIVNRLKLTPGDPVVFEEHNGHIEITRPANFTIDDFVEKHHSKKHKRISDKKIRQVREEFWSDPSKL